MAKWLVYFCINSGPSFKLCFIMGKCWNWRKDFDLWKIEQASEWTTVGSKSKFKKSFADVVRSNALPKRPVFVRLNYPDNHFMNYGDFDDVSNNYDGGNPPGSLAADAKINRSKPRRVLRWVPKAAAVKPASSLVKRSNGVTGASS